MSLHLIEDLTDDQGEPVRIIARNSLVTFELGDPEHPTRLDLVNITELTQVTELLARALAHATWDIAEQRRCNRPAPLTQVRDLDALTNAAGLLTASAEYLRTPSSEFTRR